MGVDEMKSDPIALTNKTFDKVPQRVLIDAMKDILECGIVFIRNEDTYWSCELISDVDDLKQLEENTLKQYK